MENGEDGILATITKNKIYAMVREKKLMVNNMKFAVQLVIKAIPISEGDYLKISWPVTPNIHFYKEGPSRYLSHLIGHEGEGSIFHIIKELGKYIHQLIAVPHFCLPYLLIVTLVYSFYM